MPDAGARVALVTGATGFVGSHLTEALVGRGWRVRCLTRRTSSTGWLPLDHVELVQADVGDPSPGARSALASAMRGVDVVFHLAAVTSAATDDEYFRVNVDGTRRMATMMGEVAPEAHFVLCSSLAAAGPPRPGRPAREGDRDAPQSAYGRSKLFSEQVLAASGVRHTIVRPPAVYGPRDRDILTAFRVGARGIAVRMGPPRQRLSLVHAQDLAEGIALAGEREAGGTYYMSDGVVHLWEEVVAGIGAAVGRVPRIVPLPNPILNLAARLDRTRARLLGRNPLLTPDRARELAGADWSCDDSRARRELGYVSSIGLGEGLRDTADWYRAQGWM